MKDPELSARRLLEAGVLVVEGGLAGCTAATKAWEAGVSGIRPGEDCMNHERG